MTELELAIHVSRDELGFFCYMTPDGSLIHSREQMTTSELEEHIRFYGSNVIGSDFEPDYDPEYGGADVNDAYPLGLPSFNWSM